MRSVALEDLNFETLNSVSHGFDTFTYWLAGLSDPAATLATDAEKACAARLAGPTSTTFFPSSPMFGGSWRDSASSIAPESPEMAKRE